MASPNPEPPSTGVVALESARRILSIIIEDRAADIPYSADALSRLTKLLPRNIRTADTINQLPLVVEHFLQYQPRSHYPAYAEASDLYHSIAEGLNRLHDKEEIYRTIFERKGRVSVNREKRGKRLLSVERDIERLLGIMLETERVEELFRNAEGGFGAEEVEDVKIKTGHGDEETNPTTSSSLRMPKQPFFWVDEQTQLSYNEIKRLYSNLETTFRPQSLVAQDPYLMALVDLRRNGKFVSNVLFEKRSESWPNELRGMLSLAAFSFGSEEGREERDGRYGNGEWMVDWV